MSDGVRIIGVGMTTFGRYENVAEPELAAEAIAAALSDAGVERSDVDAVLVGNVFGGPGVGQAIARDTQLTGRPLVNVENACASGTTALLQAVAWIRGGFAETVLAVGVEKLSSGAGGQIDLPDSVYTRQGLTLPALYALNARKHMNAYGVTSEQLASVAVKNRVLGAANVLALRREPVSNEEVLDSPIIADPLTRLMCCSNADGAAAAVVTTARNANGRSVALLGSALATGRHRDRLDSGASIVREVASQAYRSAGVGAGAVDVAEVHDAFVIGEILAYERLGFCGEGEGGAFVEWAWPNKGATAVNTSGGLIARGHPLGATGLAQVHEVVRQLRGEAGANQVDGARIGVTHTMGGTVIELETNACVVHVFGR